MATGPTPSTAPRVAQVNDWVGRSAPFIMRQETDRPERWPQGRLAAVESLWGEGFTGPGGAAEVLGLAASLSLSPADKLLLLGGGLGGPACAIAETSGAWIISFEAESELAAAARERVASRDCGPRVKVESWNPSAPSFGLGALDHAMSLEALRGTDPVPTLDSLAASLRPRGHIVMTELVSDRAIADTDREFAAWCRLENRLPDLPTGHAITAALTRLHYDVRVVEDVSTAHVEAALSGWRQAMQAIGRGVVPSAGSAATVMVEAELWLLRIRMMRRFGLRLVRWHAVAMS